MSEHFCKKPCKRCPFRNDIKPFLTKERMWELGNHAKNKYNSFPCHRTLGHDNEGETITTESSKECAGFLTLQIKNGANIPDGFNPSFEIVFDDEYEMLDSTEF